MKNTSLFWKKLILAALPIAFALFVILYSNLDLAELKLDNSILFLILLAILVAILPWERLISLKAAGVELELDRPQVDKAIGDLGVLKGKENVSDKRLRDLLEQLVPQLEQAKGSRILWIDDTPPNVLGERRLFRALGIETIMAESSEMARRYLDSDGDFDLIISDMRSGETSKEGGDEMPEAVRFIKTLREAEIKRGQIERYAHIPSPPVIFYSGKSYNQLLRLTGPVRREGSAVILVRGVEKLVEEVFRTLSYIRAEPIQIVVGPAPESTEATISENHFSV